MSTMTAFFFKLYYFEILLQFKITVFDFNKCKN